MAIWFFGGRGFDSHRLHHLIFNKNKGLADLATPYLRPQTVPKEGVFYVSQGSHTN